MTYQTKTVDDQHKQLQLAHGELNKQHQQVKAEKIQNEARTKQAASKFSHNLSSRLVKSTARQVASAPAESIPFAGIPLVAASTAWDIYDACETMKALNEMNHEVGIESHDSNSVCGVKVPSEKELWKHVNEKRKDIYKDFKKLID